MHLGLYHWLFFQGNDELYRLYSLYYHSAVLVVFGILMLFLSERDATLAAASCPTDRSMFSPCVVLHRAVICIYATDILWRMQDDSDCHHHQATGLTLYLLLVMLCNRVYSWSSLSGLMLHSLLAIRHGYHGIAGIHAAYSMLYVMHILHGVWLWVTRRSGRVSNYLPMSYAILAMVSIISTITTGGGGGAQSAYRALFSMENRTEPLWFSGCLLFLLICWILPSLYVIGDGGGGGGVVVERTAKVKKDV